MLSLLSFLAFALSCVTITNALVASSPPVAAPPVDAITTSQPPNVIYQVPLPDAPGLRCDLDLSDTVVFNGDLSFMSRVLDSVARIVGGLGEFRARSTQSFIIQGQRYKVSIGPARNARSYPSKEAAKQIVLDIEDWITADPARCKEFTFTVLSRLDGGPLIDGFLEIGRPGIDAEAEKAPETS